MFSGASCAPRRPDGQVLSDFEVATRFERVAKAVVGQRDADRDGEADGTFGADVDAGSGGAFDVTVDQVALDDAFATQPATTRPTSRTRVDATVGTLPRAMTLCLRAPGDARPPAAPGANDASADPLLGRCDRVDVLGRPVPVAGQETALPATPLTVDYDGEDATRIDARVRSRAAEPRDGNHVRISDVTAVIADAPAQVRIDAITPQEARTATAGAPARPARAAELEYAAGASIASADLTLESARADGTPSDLDAFVDAHIEGLPSKLGGVIDVRDGVAHRVDLGACSLDFALGTCTDAPDGIDSVDALVRPRRARGALPPGPAATRKNYASIVQRGSASEVVAHVENIDAVRVAQRDENADGRSDGPVAAHVEIGGGAEDFELALDGVAPDERTPLPVAGTDGADRVTSVNAVVSPLPSRFDVCLRPDADAPPRAFDPGRTDLLAACERTDVLGGGLVRALDATPLSVRYGATPPTGDEPTTVTTHVRTRERDLDDGGRVHRTALDATVTGVPSEIELDLLPSREPAAADPAGRPLQLDYHASDPIGGLDLQLSKERADGTPSKTSSFADVDVTGVPADLGAHVDVRDGVAHAVEVQACDLDQVALTCANPATRGQVGSVRLLTRPVRARGGLPPAPSATNQEGIAVLQRFDVSEVSGLLRGIQGASVRQRDPDGPAGEAGVVGFDVAAGTGAPFSLLLDSRGHDAQFVTEHPDGTVSTGPAASTRLEARVPALPTTLRGCVRSLTAASPAPEGSGEALLAECERHDVLGRKGPTPHGSDLDTTPLTIDYRASTPATVTADLTSVAVDPADANRPHRTDLHAEVAGIPTRFRADVIPPADATDDTPARDLEFQYVASSTIGSVDLQLEQRRANRSTSEDDTFVRTRAEGIPRFLGGAVRRSGDLVTSADVQTCEFDFEAGACPSGSVRSSADAIDLLLRPRRRRGSLPPVAPDHASSFLAISGRPIAPESETTTGEVRGHVERVGGLALRQPDRNGDGEADGLLGFEVAAGGGRPFDLLLDTLGVDDRYADDVRFDGRRPKVERRVRANVERVPEVIAGCLREESDSAPPVPFAPGHPEFDRLLEGCRSDRLAGADAEAPRLTSTPLSLRYGATAAGGASTEVETEVFLRQHDPEDEDRLAITDLETTIADVPASITSDVVSPVAADPAAGTPARPLQLHYDGEGAIARVDLDLEQRRADSLCLDPRAGHKALCVKGVLRSLPQRLDATVADNGKDTTFEFTTDGGAVRPTVGPLRIEMTKPDGAADESHMAVDVTAEDLPSTLRGRLRKADLDGDPATALELGEIDLSACPAIADPAAGECPGVGSVSFTATNQIEPPPAALAGLRLTNDLAFLVGASPFARFGSDRIIFDPDDVPQSPQTDHDLDILSRGSQFRANGRIGNLRKAFYSRLHGDGAPSPTTRMSVGFGSGEGDDELGLRVDADSGIDAVRIDGTVKQVPRTLDLCLRDAVNDIEAAAPISFNGVGRIVAPPTLLGALQGDRILRVARAIRTDSPTFCERQDTDKLALQLALGAAAGGSEPKPDVDISRLEVKRAGGVEHTEGTLSLTDIGQRIDVLQAKGDAPEITIEGHPIDDDMALADAVGRVKFDIATYDRSAEDPDAARPFPFRSLDAEAVAVAAAEHAQDSTSPVFDPSGGTDRTVDEPNSTAGLATNGGNFLVLAAAGPRVEARGSVPNVRRIAVAPRPCDEQDPRFPPRPEDSAPGAPAFSAENAPSYTCVRAVAAPGQKLGIAARVRSDDSDDASAIAFDGGLLEKIPSGDRGLEATLAQSPKRVTEALAPTCRTHADAITNNGCRPPQLDVRLDNATNETTTVRGKLGLGRLDHLIDLKRVQPEDVYTKRVDPEEDPADYTRDIAELPDGFDAHGARLKLGIGNDRQDVALGLNLRLPQRFTLDQPLIFGCEHEDRSAACGAGSADPEDFEGFAAFDAELRAQARDGNGDPVGRLGRLQVLINDFSSKADPRQTIITGAGTGDESPEEAPSLAGEYGVNLPGVVDARLYTRNRFQAGDNEHPISYTRIDGRASAPLSLGARFLGSRKSDKTTRKGKTRNGDKIATTAIRARNLPGSGDPGPDSAPTFRVEAEVQGFPNGGDLGEDFLSFATGFIDCNNAIREAVTDALAILGLVTPCVVLPAPELLYMDLQIDAHPDDDEPAARHIEAVTRSEGAKNIVDARGSQSIDGSQRADVSVGADLRLHPFDIGLQFENLPAIGIGPLSVLTFDIGTGLRADLKVGLDSERTERLQLTQDLASMKLAATGPTEVTASARTKGVFTIQAEGPAGLVQTEEAELESGETSQDVRLDVCDASAPLASGENGGVGALSFNSGRLTGGIALHHPDFFDDAESEGDDITDLLTPVLTALPVALSNVISKTACFGAEDPPKSLIASGHPQAPYDRPEHPVSAAADAEPVVAPQVTTSTLEDPQPLVVDSGEEVVVCGNAVHSTVVVEAGGTLRVGGEGEITAGTGGIATTCDGTLALRATTILVRGTITSAATRGGARPGSPGLGGAGSGASHAGRGGNGGNGAVSPPAYREEAVLADVGEAARGVAGRGGGVISLEATHNIDVRDGAIDVRGGNAPFVDCNLAPTAAPLGGGSGGRVAMRAPILLSTDATVLAGGGAGGRGLQGGGGGGGGVVTIDTVLGIGLTANATSATGGPGGNACAADGTDGVPGGSGDVERNERERLGGARLISDRTRVHNGNAEVRVSAVQRTTGADTDPLQAMVCGRRVTPNVDGGQGLKASDFTLPTAIAGSDVAVQEFFNWSTDLVGDLPSGSPFGFGSPELVGPTGASIRGCFAINLGQTTASNALRDFDIPATLWGDGYVAVVVLAVTPQRTDTTSSTISDANFPQRDCVTGRLLNIFFPLPGVDDVDRSQCEFEVPQPRSPQVLFTMDSTRPEIAGFGAASGLAGCPGDTICTRTSSVKVDLNASDSFEGTATGVQFSGLRSGQCSVNDDAFSTCGLGADVEVELDDDQGAQKVEGRVSDNAGHSRSATDAVRFWFDDRAPLRPQLTLTTVGPGTNGWFRQAPRLAVDAEDRGGASESSAFADDAITLLIDGVERVCGTPAAAPLAGSEAHTVACTQAELEDDVPASGRHEFTARARDIAGNVSALSEPQQMQVDTEAPSAVLVLGPNTPDGARGWYRTNPVVTFAAGDGPGESGVDVAGEVPGDDIRFAIVDSQDEPGPLTLGTYEPTDDIVLPDGEHLRVCWTVTDVAGNVSERECSDPVKVDGARPSVTAVMTPAAPPAGQGGWFSEPVTVSFDATDTLSGVSGTGAGVFVSVDGGDFAALGAGSRTLGDGEHEVCFFARDVAGNDGGAPGEADPDCVSFRVDETAPLRPEVLVADGPDGTTNGWVRDRVRFDFAGADRVLDATGTPPRHPAFAGVDEDSLGVELSPSGDAYEPLTVTRPDGTRRNVQAAVGPGLVTACARVRDLARNLGPEGCASRQVDDEAPTVAVTLTPATGTAPGGIHTVAPTFDVTADDDRSGINSSLAPSGVFVAVDGGPFLRLGSIADRRLEGTGKHEVCAVAIDLAGNRSPTVCRTATVDTSAPVVALTVDPDRPDGDAGWYRTRPTVAAGGEDERETAVLTTQLRLDTGALFTGDTAAEGISRICAHSTDDAGNAAVVVASDPDEPACRTLRVDSVAPSVTLTAPAASGLDGVHVVRPTITSTGGDPGGSGLARVEMSLDGGVFEPRTTIVVPDGTHEVASRSVDLAGNLSAVRRHVLRVDSAGPATTLDVHPPAANSRGRLRFDPIVAVGVTDPRDGTGPAGATLTVNAAAPAPYLGPLRLGEGTWTLRATGRDRAGLSSTTPARTLRVDLTAPVPLATTATVAGTLLPTSATLRFSASDPSGGKVRVRVSIFNTLGGTVRTELAPSGGDADGYRAAGSGTVRWDLREDDGDRVPPGLYVYRVQATDEAGNTASSTESAAFLVIL